MSKTEPETTNKPKDARSCIAVIANDISVFDKALWLHGPLPTDQTTAEKQLEQTVKLLETSKQLESIVEKLQQQIDNESSSSANASNNTSDDDKGKELLAKLKKLQNTVDDRQRRLKILLKEIAEFHNACKNVADKLNGAEQKMINFERNRTNPIEAFDDLKLEIESIQTAVDNVRKISTRISNEVRSLCLPLLFSFFLSCLFRVLTKFFF